MNGWLENDDYRVRPIGGFLKLILPGWVRGITLAPFGIYVKDLNDQRVIDHEDIHWQQQVGLYIVNLIMFTIVQLILLFKGIFAWWFIPFSLCPFLTYYVFYLVEWLIKLIKYKGQAYRNISFERAAYAGDKGKFTWIKYLW